MGTKVSTVQQKIAALAGRAHGVVTRSEMLRAGITPKEIKSRVGRGYLIRVHRGVYRVGHAAPSTLATYMAAVKACGEGAALSGRPAAHLWGLLKSRRPPAPEVTAPTARRVTGVRTRRRKLSDADGTAQRGIPVTTIPQTLVDLAAELSEEDLARACHEANVKYCTTPAQVASVIVRCSHAPGVQRLKRVMSGDVKVTLSKLERRFVKLVKEAGLSLPETNRVASGRYVDCRWSQHRLTVELQSYQFHNTRRAWEHDHARRREAHARGDEFRQFTWHDVTLHARETAAQVRVLLSASRPRPL
jgi:predicted transcriptional regulator of viral defense system